MRFLFLAYRDVKNPAAVGGDFYLWELAKGAVRLGNRVTFLSSRFYDSEETELVDGVEVVRFNGNKGLPYRFFLEYLKRRRGSIDVVVEEAIGGQRPPFLAGLYVQEPLIAVWHQRHYKIFREQYPFPIWGLLSILELVLARVYKNRTILTPSKGAKEQLLQLGLRSENVSVVYDGVGDVFGKAKIDRKRDDMIICLGKLRRYKRFDHAILALKRIQSRVGRPVRLIIAGKVSEIDSGYVNFLRQLAIQLGLGDSVEFRSNISESEKVELLERARLLLQPSPVEGFGVVIAEANRCGTPVVVSDGIPGDVVINGQNGFVYRFGDVETLAKDVDELFRDNDLWSRMSKQAEELSRRFRWEDSVLEFLKISEHLSSPSTLARPRDS